MKCIEVRVPGGPEALIYTQRPDPEPAPGEVVVDTAACGVNFIDIYHRTGLYPQPLPAVIGLEGAGTVAAVGADAGPWRVGDRVAWANTAGSYASRVRVPAARLVRVPEALDLNTAAAAMLQGLTAHFLSHSVFALEPGDWVLVHAAAGGVGRLLTQMLNARGMRVIGTTSTAQKAALVRSAGASEVILYTEEDFAPALRRITGGDGVRVVFDAVGATTFKGSLASLQRRGCLVMYGQASGPAPAVEVGDLMRGGSLYLTRPSLFDYIAEPEALAARAAALFDWLVSGKVQLRIEAEFPLRDAAQAHSLLASRGSAGKLLLIP